MGMMTRKRWWVLITAALVVVITAVAVAVFVGYPNDEGPSDGATNSGLPDDCADTPKKTGIAEPEKPPKDGGVDIVDKGVSASNVFPDRSEPSGGISFGVELENTSTLVARQVTVSYKVAWPNGKPVEGMDDAEQESLQPLTIGALLPGQRFGVGVTAEIDNEYGVKPDFTVETEVTVDEWWQRDNDSHRFAGITGAAYKPGVTPNEDLPIEVESEHCKPVGTAQVAGLYRDDAGNIIGGFAHEDVWRSSTESAGGDVDIYLKYKPGKTTGLYIDDPWPRDPSSVREAWRFDVEPVREDTEIHPYVSTDVD